MFIIPAPTSVAFNLFSIPIYKYGIIMALAIFVAMLISNKLYNLYGEKKDLIVEYAPLMIILGIIGARLYFCALNYNFYLSNPIEIINLRQGGLSVHGAIFLGILGVWFVAKKLKLSLLKILDALSCATIFGQAIGRWGNYFNSEAFGFPVAEQNWGLFIPKNLRPVEFCDFSLFHPTFLYESLLDLLGFIILFIVFAKTGKNKPGLTFFAYLVIYSVIRFFIEGMRIDSALNIGSIPIAEIVSMILFICGIVGIVKLCNNNSKI